MENSKTQPKKCDINFGKVQNKSVKVYQGEKPRKDIEIIGSKGAYSIWTDPKNKSLESIRGKTGSLRDVKGAISKAMCSDPAPAKASSKSNTRA